MALTRARRFSSISTIPVDLDNSSVYKVITIGDAGVGKSTLMASYARGTYQQDLSQQSNVDGKIVKRGQSVVQVALWDTAGQERYDSITPNYYRGTHGCILCFDITNEQSYADLFAWHEKLKYHCDPLPPTILVGLKSDLRQSNQYIQTVQTPADCKLAGRNLGLPYKEVSCLKQEMVEDAFDTLLDMMEGSREPNNPTNDENNNSVSIVPKKEKTGVCRNLC